MLSQSKSNVVLGHFVKYELRVQRNRWWTQGSKLVLGQKIEPQVYSQALAILIKSFLKFFFVHFQKR